MWIGIRGDRNRLQSTSV